MKVLKFGGTSIGSVEKIKSVAKLILDDKPKIVVLSAMSGTTNNLEKITKSLYNNKVKKAKELISILAKKYYKLVEELFADNNYKNKGKDLVKQHISFIKSFTLDMFTLFEEKAIMAQGELLSTALLHYYIKSQNKKSALLPSLNFMRIDKNHEPDEYYIKENIKRELEKYPNNKLFITQGYICRNAYGEIDNLKRGGSDYSASLIGVAINAKEIQIWTDISGFHNNDPRFVKNTKPIKKLSFDEAAELAYFGAKILHPSSILPAKIANVPVRLKNTMKPLNDGTLITSNVTDGGIKAVAAKDDITAIKVKSSRMLMAYGFLRKVFEVFERYKTPIDMITTSEIAVSVTIDNTLYIDEIINELKYYGTVDIDKNLSIICVVGNLIAEEKGLILRVLKALEKVPLRMVSYGGSLNNVSLLVKKSEKINALNYLSEHLF